MCYMTCILYVILKNVRLFYLNRLFLLSYPSPTQVIPSPKYPALHLQLDISTDDPDPHEFDNVACKSQILQGLHQEQNKFKSFEISDITKFK
jgi:hypothetical protein